MERVEDHTGLAHYVASLYLPEGAVVGDSEEFAEALIGIWEASQTYNPECGVTFATYAQTKARWRINNMRRKATATYERSVGRLGDAQFDKDLLPSNNEGPDIGMQIQEVLSHLHLLSKREAEVLVLALEGVTFYNIALLLGVSKQRVSQCLYGDRLGRLGAIKKLRKVLGNDEG